MTAATQAMKAGPSQTGPAQTGDVRIDAARIAPPTAVPAKPTATTEPDADLRERFLPLSRAALFERLTRDTAWPASQAADVRKFFRYLDFWRAQAHTATLHDMEQTYEAFSPDSDLLVTRAFTAVEKRAMQSRLVGQVQNLMEKANYQRIDPSQVQLIMTKETHYGLDLHVDMNAFEEIMIYFRGKTTRTETRRDRKKLYLKKEQFELPIFSRLFVMFKIKPHERRIDEVMALTSCDRKQAEKVVAKERLILPPQVKSDYLYLKLFKNIPQSDIEMIFPNTKIKFRMFDKVKLSATAGGGLGAGIFGAAGKIALISTNPVAAAGAAIGLGGVAFRQVMSVVNQKNRYMVTMAQNLYFHALADNRGVMTLMADRAAEEEVKEDMLLYALLAKETVTISDIRDIDAAIETYLHNTYDLKVNFDVTDALQRLIADGIVTQRADGRLITMPPKEAATHIDKLWDGYLDRIATVDHDEGKEFDTEQEMIETSAS